MKRTIALLLVLVSMLSLTACGGSTPALATAPETAPVTTEAPTEASTTEPTLSPEEVLYNSLPDRMKQAVDLEIVELSQLEDLTRIVTVGEASTMLQKAYVHRTGVESKALKELMNTPDYAERTADRGWVLTVPGVTDMELSKGELFENYMQWQNYLNYDNGANGEWGAEDLWFGFDDRLGTEIFSFYEDDEVGLVYYPDIPQAADDLAEYFAMMGADSLYGPEEPGCYDDVYAYAFKTYDSTTGKKFFDLEDGYINPTKTLTVADAAEYALKFYHYPNPMGVPVFVAPEEVGKYSTDIITADLLTKETELPAVSCEKLPSNWHGVVMKDMGYTMRTTMLDDQIYEYEIQTIKEAGFNFIGLELDFSWLQEYILQDPQFEPFKGLVAEEDVGKFSMARLEQLDRVIALCMKYDIHVNLRCVDFGDNHTCCDRFRDISNSKAGPKLANRWQAIARRYADIPNEYLSFTLFTSPAGAVTAVLMPSVEAIREVSPDRCVIADICGWTLKKQDAITFAKAGVALSSRIGTEEKMKMFYHRNFFDPGQYIQTIDAAGEKFVKNFTWPCDGVDAEKLLASTSKDRVYETMAVAEEYGVGFMVSDFGVFADEFEVYRGAFFYPTYRYPDEGYRAMIEDITSTVAAKGYGWCFSNWFGYFGVTNSGPVYENASYEQVEDYPCYIDTAMYSWFKEINVVK